MQTEEIYFPITNSKAKTLDCNKGIAINTQVLNSIRLDHVDNSLKEDSKSAIEKLRSREENLDLSASERALMNGYTPLVRVSPYEPDNNFEKTQNEGLKINKRSSIEGKKKLKQRITLPQPNRKGRSYFSGSEAVKRPETSDGIRKLIRAANLRTTNY